MSIIDKYAEIKVNTHNPNDTVFRRVWDPDFLTPDIFFNMDEIEEMQVLRKFHKGCGRPVYAGTYQVLFKTSYSISDNTCPNCLTVRSSWALWKKIWAARSRAEAAA